MFTGAEIRQTLSELGVTHVVWLPDSLIGTWEEALESSAELQLVRVCREGEAWPLAAGLLLGGKRPVVMIQTTGLFESGDALRNVLFDMQLPVFAIVGARNWLATRTRDSARQFAEPILQAWGIAYRVIAQVEDKPLLAEHYRACRDQRRPGAVLVAEGGDG